MSKAQPGMAGRIGAGLFFTGITYASTLNYGAIVAIETLGIPNATYALLLMAASLMGALASVSLGWLSDRVGDRRLLVIGCALAGAFAFTLIYLFRNALVFALAVGIIMPFGHALFSQSFAFARSYYAATDPARADFMSSIMRTVFSTAWAIVPPAVGVLAAATSVFELYGVAAAAYVVVALIYLLMLRDPRTRIGAPKAADGSSTALPKAEADPVIFVGILGWVLVSIAIQLTNVSAPLLVTGTLGGSYADLGLYAGLAAAIELPFMVLWGFALRWVRKHAIIVIASLLYAAYLILLSRATSITEVLWLQLINGPATAALMSIPIAYLQEAIRGRVGLSTSLLDVVFVIAALSAAAIFGIVTAASPNYPFVFVIGGVLAASGAVVLLGAHQIMRPLPAPAT